ncbi:hypothetical protein LSH36_487g04029 [Paralvinella palmiformis]|uniref:Uncharacterized protein n=1 Tax=Paralvinella palmiformis TaxID=53620 RepID=A0AAD9J8Q7_9ANNE|nr:hypothetical protein LSH36_487g04029 [Paralvinella palmiformis]
MVTVTFCFVIFNLFVITQVYLSRKVDMEIKVHHQTELPFPAVTICNMNPYRRSAIENSPMFKTQKTNIQKRTSTKKTRHKRATGVWFCMYE